MTEPQSDGGAAVAAPEPGPSSKDVDISVHLSSVPLSTSARLFDRRWRFTLSPLTCPFLCSSLLCSGGLEVLFGRVKRHSLRLSPALHGDEGRFTLRALILYMKERLIKERPDLFAQEDSVSELRTTDPALPPAVTSCPPSRLTTSPPPLCLQSSGHPGAGERLRLGAGGWAEVRAAGGRRGDVHQHSARRMRRGDGSCHRCR